MKSSLPVLTGFALGSTEKVEEGHESQDQTPGHRADCHEHLWHDTSANPVSLI